MNVSLRIYEFFEEPRISPFFIQTVRCEWESLEKKFKHDNAEGEDLYLVDILHSLIYILFGCHVPRGPSVINDVFSLGKVCFVAKITGNAEISQLKLDWHVSAISIKLVFLFEAN